MFNPNFLFLSMLVLMALCTLMNVSYETRTTLDPSDRSWKSKIDLVTYKIGYRALYQVDSAESPQPPDALNTLFQIFVLRRHGHFLVPKVIFAVTTVLMIFHDQLPLLNVPVLQGIFRIMIVFSLEYLALHTFTLLFRLHNPFFAFAAFILFFVQLVLELLKKGVNTPLVFMALIILISIFSVKAMLWIREREESVGQFSLGMFQPLVSLFVFASSLYIILASSGLAVYVAAHPEVQTLHTSEVQQATEPEMPSISYMMNLPTHVNTVYTDLAELLPYTNLAFLKGAKALLSFDYVSNSKTITDINAIVIIGQIGFTMYPR